MEEVCKECNGTKKVSHSTGSGGGQMSFHMWWGDCTKCGPLVTMLRELNERISIGEEAETWDDWDIQVLDNAKKRLFVSADSYEELPWACSCGQEGVGDSYKTHLHLPKKS